MVDLERITRIPMLPDRSASMHKGQAGRVAIVAGSRGMSGAACLAGLAALRSGAGLVRLLVPDSILPIVASSEPSLMTVALPEDRGGQLANGATLAIDEAALHWASALAAGPGLGSARADNGVRGAVRRVLRFDGPVVLDADGLNATADGLVDILQSRPGPPAVLTPHPGEMARLRAGAGLESADGQDDNARIRTAHEYAARARCVVLLKGHRTVVATPDQFYINTTGNAGMATGGMGDVLTGLIAALLGLGMDPFKAACLAAYAHGLAGDMLARQFAPFGYLARELADHLPQALTQSKLADIGFK